MFKAREYDKVKPGVLSIPGMKKSRLTDPPDFENAEDASPSAFAAKSAPQSSVEPSVGISPNSSAPSAAFLWTCAVAAITLLVSLVIFWKRPS